MHDPHPVANYRTKLEAEVAAGFLQTEGIPFVIQSAEGMLHGPLGAGATILVRVEDVAEARAILLGEDEHDEPPPSRTVKVASSGDPEAIEMLRGRLDRGGIKSLARIDLSSTSVYVRREDASRSMALLARDAESA